MALLGARRVTALSLTLPPSGAWLGEATLDSGEPPTAGTATLTIGDLELSCTVLPDRGGLDAPARPTVVLAGGSGWRTKLPVGAFASPGGVRLSTVLADLARLTGERVGPATEVQLPPDYGWPAGTRGLAVLADLVSRGALPMWRITPRGWTVFTPWPASGAADAFGVIVDRDLARGVRAAALSDRIAAWLPGATVEGTTIARVRLLEREQETRVMTWES
jgi:hypothetical protein